MELNDRNCRFERPSNQPRPAAIIPLVCRRFIVGTLSYRPEIDGLRALQRRAQCGDVLWRFGCFGRFGGARAPDRDQGEPPGRHPDPEGQQAWVADLSW